MAEAIEAARTRSFAYGDFDCCLFAADVVFAMTGIDYATPFRGYHSRPSAYRLIAEYGSLTVLLTSVLGEPMEPSFAGRGDVVLADIATVEGGESAGICLGVFCAFPKDIGLALHPRTVAKLAWKI
jgi:hypothetical protein